MDLTHPFKDKCSPDELLGDGIKNEKCVLLNTFCARLEWFAAQNKVRLDPDAVKGDGLELLVEFLIKWMGTDNRIGITDYKVVPITDDRGVDGVGISTLNLRPKTVQVKYRQADHILTATKDNLMGFAFRSLKEFKVLVTDDKNMLIISTAKEMCWYTEDQMFRGSVQVICRDDFRGLVDSRLGFWEEFYKSWQESRIRTKKVEPKVLREHQDEAVDAVFSAMKHGIQKGIIECPTGTGKSLIQSEIVRRLFQPSQLNPNLPPQL